MKRKLPKFDAAQLPHGLSFDLVPSALHRWNAALAAKDDDKDRDEEKVVTLDIYDFIGADWMGAGWTAKRVSGILRNNKGKNVTVNLNSPGGDLFEGIAIYNILRDHDGEVNCRVIGLAASAASIIAMAGDTIQTARAGFMMIHNCWVIALGNRNDLREAADTLEPFDDVMASIYAARTGLEKKAVVKMMDKETWFSGDQAIEDGFADELLPADVVEEKDEVDGAAASLRSIEAKMARYMPRNERRAAINAFKDLFGKQSAAEPQDRGTRDAAPKATLDAGAVEARAKVLVDSFAESLRA